ncbi:hypothetical protein QBC46DRAFT_434767 [Diplogelasinospora grovesii]|uniref:SH3 domain-containing protein n=1 Tax=Diplogelasinospora grovesii TaxID=303347 RepID=A0AAN6N929_9PEZI|nr:hypothetical protein QBC46DRAFT_434767 [Diplogelasinospora grovesii]
MAVDIEELILAPFREVVERAKEAVANAEAAAEDDEEASKRMVKAGKAVLREGERALKRLQPLWDSQVEKFGDTFKAGMSKSDEIEEERRKLEDLLYDFEDFTELDTFDEERYTEVQSATKALALHVLDIIKRLKIDGVPISPPPVRAPSFPPLPPLPPLPLASRPSSRTLSAATRPLTISRRDSLPSAADQAVSPTERRQSGGGGPAFRKRTPLETKRLTPQGLLRSDTKVSHASPTYSVDSLPPYSSRESRLVPPPLDVTRVIEIPQVPPLPQPPHNITLTPLSERPRRQPGNRRLAPEDSERIAERPIERRPSMPNVLGTDGGQVRIANEPSSPASTAPSSALDIPSFPLPRTTAWVSDQASVTGSRGRPVPVREPVVLPMRETAIPEDEAVTTPTHTDMINFDSPLSHFISKLNRTNGRTSSLAQRSEIGHPGPPSLPSAAEFDEGLMVAEDWTTVVSDGANSQGQRHLSTMPSREADCSIGSKSSLYQLKGFCDGAQAYKQGGHWEGIKKTVGYVAGATAHIGRCISCGYAHHYDELSLDVDRDPKANFNNSGVRFRIRILYKSHLAAQKMTEAYYACLFCAQTGATVREGDATVFASSDALFRHLAHHPQPLPEVPGVTVLYGKDFANDDPRLNDFDLHFVNPPIPGSGIPGSGIPGGVAQEVANLPIATAKTSHIQRYGEKKLPRPDGIGEKDLLQFFVGARIIGVEFPVRWGGKWASGWHDGVWGAFPAKSIDIEKPRKNEIPPLLQTGAGAYSVSVTTRWKWNPSDAADKGWLTFGQGETISNVGWLFKEHWCWSGTNSKGKFGVFPRSHVNFDSIDENASPILRPGSSRSMRSTRSKRRDEKSSGVRKFFGRSRAVSSSAASSISGVSGIVEIIM